MARIWQDLEAENPAHAATPAHKLKPADIAAPEDSAVPVQPVWRADTFIRQTRERQSAEAQEVPVALGRPLYRHPALLLAVAAILAVLIGYPIFKGSARLKQSADATAALRMDSNSSHKFELALRVEKRGDDLELDWNRAAPILAKASGAILTIREKNAKEVTAYPPRPSVTGSDSYKESK